MKSQTVTIQIKATEQYFPVVLHMFITQYKVVPKFKFVDKSLCINQSNKSY